MGVIAEVGDSSSVLAHRVVMFNASIGRQDAGRQIRLTHTIQGIVPRHGKVLQGECWGLVGARGIQPMILLGAWCGRRGTHKAHSATLRGRWVVDLSLETVERVTSGDVPSHHTLEGCCGRGVF